MSRCVSVLLLCGGLAAQERLRQRERHHPVAAPPHASPAGAYDHVLLAVHAVGHRRRLAARREVAAPQLAAGLDIECTNRSIERRGNEDEAPGRRYGAAKRW